MTPAAWQRRRRAVMKAGGPAVYLSMLQAKMALPPPRIERPEYRRRDGSIERLRSKWEYDFAEMLDKLGVGWEYEPRSFRVLGRRYTPDFLVCLPEGDVFVEIHPMKAGGIFARAVDKILAADEVIRKETGVGLLVLDTPDVARFRARLGELRGWCP